MKHSLIQPLPTLPSLGIQPSSFSAHSQTIDPNAIIKEWFSSFTQSISTLNIPHILDNLFLPNGNVYWRDLLSMTWDFRTFSGSQNVRQFLVDRLALSKIHDLSLKYQGEKGNGGLTWVGEDLVYIQFFFGFKTSHIGEGEGVVRLFPIRASDGEEKIEWRAHVITTSLLSLQSHPELTGPNRSVNHPPSPSLSPDSLTEEEPTVLIVGGGQAGLSTAARLKYLGVKCLVLEKEGELGGNWKKRYDSLCLHDPVWYDHMAYMAFPETWPVYAPASKMSLWLQTYARTLDLPILLSSSLTSASFNHSTGKWQCTISQSNGRVIEFHSINHLVLTTGLSTEGLEIPSYPGMSTFKGSMKHSMEYKKPSEDEMRGGKKVVVIGACTSGHDVASDYASHGIDITIYQRSSTYIMSVENGWKVSMAGTYEESGPPTHIADLINNSYPNLLVAESGKRVTRQIARLDKDLLDGLHSVGFRTNDGYNGAGALLLAWDKGGGYYLDVGASQMIISKKIKLKNDSEIDRFEENGIRFKDGSFLEADSVIFATGLGDPRTTLRSILPPEEFKQIKKVWGMNDEGEIRGIWRDLSTCQGALQGAPEGAQEREEGKGGKGNREGGGIKNIWIGMGNLAMCRVNSRFLALQIKAIEEGLFRGNEERYSAPEE